MDTSLSDSDDSAFLFNFNKCPKKTQNSDSTHKQVSKDDVISVENSNDLAESGMEKFSNSKITSNNDAGRYAVFPEASNRSFDLSVPQNILINGFSCLLCLKNFNSEPSQISHMKQCAKKFKMTTSELLKVLEHHKNNLKENIKDSKGFSKALNLSGGSKKRKISTEVDKKSCQLALGLALSKSLAESDLKQKSLLNREKEKIELKSVTLEKYGFMSSMPAPHDDHTNRKKRWKNERFSNYQLFEQTKEGRERLMTEKAAVILLSHDLQSESDQVCLHVDNKRRSSFDDQNRPRLWELGGTENCAGSWYVEAVEKMISDDQKDEIIKSPTEISNELQEEILKLNLPSRSLVEDWKRLINDEASSDFSIESKDEKKFHLHSLVVLARCPFVSRSVFESKLSSHNSSIIEIFLGYLYCGLLDGISLGQISILEDLAYSLNHKELVATLTTLRENFAPGKGVKPGESHSKCEMIESKNAVVEDPDEITIIGSSSDDCKKALQHESSPEVLVTLEHSGESKKREDLFEITCVAEKQMKGSKTTVSGADDGVEIHIPSEPDFEVPYFDPYEHFNAEFPVCDSPRQCEKNVSDTSISFRSCTFSVIENNHVETSNSYCAPEHTSTPMMNPASLPSSNSKCTPKANLRTTESGDNKPLECSILTNSLAEQFEKDVLDEKNEKYIEMSPAEFVGEASPQLDYSRMGASSLKRQLARFGLKKSLSKNKAKKILRHIYEELHPVVNIKSGRIVKRVQGSVSKIRRCPERSNSRRPGKERKSVGKKRASKKRVEEEVRSDSPKKPSTMEKSLFSGSSSSDLDDSLGYGGQSDAESDSEATTAAGPPDTFAAAHRFILENRDLHRKILMYRPIWLEAFRKDLMEAYKKKFKLTDIMDFLDAQCISYRCESQFRTNSARRTQKKAVKKK